MKKLMLGNEAVARGAYEAGVRVSVAYPGTPSTEITENMANFSKEEVYYEWAPNEKVALEVAIGASMGGALCTLGSPGGAAVTGGTTGMGWGAWGRCSGCSSSGWGSGGCSCFTLG